MSLTGEREQREAREKADRFRPELPKTKVKAPSLGKDADGKPLYYDLINREGKVLRAAIISIKGASVMLKRESDQKQFTIQLSTLSPESQRMIGYLSRRFPTGR